MLTSERTYPQMTPELADQVGRLAPRPAEAFRAFSRSVVAEGWLPTKTKQLIAVAVAHVTQCPHCIRSHTRAALRHGASAHQIMAAMWVAAEIRAGAACAHPVLALDAITRSQTSDVPEVAGASTHAPEARASGAG